MNKSNINDRLLWAIAVCLLVNTVVFAVPVVYRFIKNEISWIEHERQARAEEEKEAERLAEARKMCTAERVSLFNEALVAPGKEIPDNLLERIRALPDEGMVPGNIELFLARQYRIINTANVQLPLTIPDCLATWPSFPAFAPKDTPPLKTEKPFIPEVQPLTIRLKEVLSK